MNTTAAADTIVYAVVTLAGETKLVPVAGNGRRTAATVEIVRGTAAGLRSYTTRDAARRAAGRALAAGRTVISADTITTEQRRFYAAFAELNRGVVRAGDMFRDAMAAYANPARAIELDRMFTPPHLEPALRIPALAA